MIILKKVTDLQHHLELYRKKNNHVGFVPTMGALHDGHLSLLKYCKGENNLTVCSIFVNPTQFNDKKDYEKYPITIEKDIYKLQQAGCDVLFLPSLDEIYPDGTVGLQHYDLGYLETTLEGKYRPGHFQGVCAVVERLLRMVEPDILYLGQKDYQQCLVIKRLTELMQWQDKVQLRICPTIREKDGLAMSSRNMRLNADERKTAVSISAVLNFLKNNINTASFDSLRSTARTMLEEKGFGVDYVELADADNLHHVEMSNGHEKIVALIAARLHDVRLIDNMIMN